MILYNILFNIDIPGFDYEYGLFKRCQITTLTIESWNMTVSQVNRAKWTLIYVQVQIRQICLYPDPPIVIRSKNISSTSYICFLFEWTSYVFFTLLPCGFSLHIFTRSLPTINTMFRRPSYCFIRTYLL